MGSGGTLRSSSSLLTTQVQNNTISLQSNRNACAFHYHVQPSYMETLVKGSGHGLLTTELVEGVKRV